MGSNSSTFRHSLFLRVFGIIIPASCTHCFSAAETEHCDQGHLFRRNLPEG